MIDFSLASQLVGSYSKPRWLADHDKAYSLHDDPWWKLPAEDLPEALDDAVNLAVADQERAGLDLITDGEQRRQSFSGYFFRLGGINLTNWTGRSGFGTSDVAPYLERRQMPNQAVGLLAVGPVVSGPISWTEPLSVDDFSYLKTRTRRPKKATVIGPATLAVRIVDQHYGDLGRLMFALADASNKEVRALEAAGADLIQIDDPEIHFALSRVRGHATEALDRALAGVTARTAVHLCYGYARTLAAKRVNPKYAEALEIIAASKVDEISLEYEQPGHDPDVLEHTGTKGVILGLLNLNPDAPVETVEHIIARAKAALEVIPAERLRLAPDCGMWFLPRDRAYGKIRALALASRSLRNERTK